MHVAHRLAPPALAVFMFRLMTWICQVNIRIVANYFPPYLSDLLLKGKGWESECGICTNNSSVSRSHRNENQQLALKPAVPACDIWSSIWWKYSRLISKVSSWLTLAFPALSHVSPSPSFFYFRATFFTQFFSLPNPLHHWGRFSGVTVWMAYLLHPCPHVTLPHKLIQ